MNGGEKRRRLARAARRSLRFVWPYSLLLFVVQTALFSMLHAKGQLLPPRDPLAYPLVTREIDRVPSRAVLHEGVRFSREHRNSVALVAPSGRYLKIDLLAGGGTVVHSEDHPAGILWRSLVFADVNADGLDEVLYARGFPFDATRRDGAELDSVELCYAEPGAPWVVFDSYAGGTDAPAVSEDGGGGRRFQLEARFVAAREPAFAPSPTTTFAALLTARGEGREERELRLYDQTDPVRRVARRPLNHTVSDVRWLRPDSPDPLLLVAGTARGGSAGDVNGASAYRPRGMVAAYDGRGELRWRAELAAGEGRIALLPGRAKEELLVLQQVSAYVPPDSTGMVMYRVHAGTGKVHERRRERGKGSWLEGGPSEELGIASLIASGDHRARLVRRSLRTARQVRLPGAVVLEGPTPVLRTSSGGIVAAVPLDQHATALIDTLGGVQAYLPDARAVGAVHLGGNGPREGWLLTRSESGDMVLASVVPNPYPFWWWQRYGRLLVLFGLLPHLALFAAYGLVEYSTYRRGSQRRLRRAHRVLRADFQRQSGELIEANRAMRSQIAERERTELELLRQRHHLETIVDHVQDGLIVVDSGLRTVRTNAAFNVLFRLEPGEAMGLHLRELFPAGSGGSALVRFVETVAQTRDGEAEVQIELATYRQHARYVHAFAIPMESRGDDRGSSIMILMRDITRFRDIREHEGGEIESIVGRSPRMRELIAQIHAAARTDSTVMITGESGTGKELVARELHDRSDRSTGAFVRVNCAALSEHLLESELFGHVRGAFTGAVRNRIGRFEYARGGTILLDEVGEMSPSMQTKLLRVLQEREIERVGDNRPIRVDVRVLAATNRDLEQEVRTGHFREDLFFRLNVLPLHVPPLRERPGDIPLLVAHLMPRLRERIGKPLPGVSDEAMRALENYSWPGNVRELENTLERAAIFCRESVVQPHHLPPEVQGSEERRVERDPGEEMPPEEEGATLPSTIEAQDAEPDEREELVRALEGAGWNVARAARRLGISRNTLYRRMAEHDVRRPA